MFSENVDRSERLYFVFPKNANYTISFFQRMLIIQFLFPRKSYSSNSLLSKFFHLSRKDSLGIYKDGVVDVDGVAVDVGITSADT